MLDFADADSGRYQLTAHLRSEPLSAVYQAFDSETQRTVVLRYCQTSAEIGYPLAPSLRSGLSSLRELRHPNILPLLNYWDEANQFVIALPAAAASTLRRRLDSLSGPDLAVQVGLRIAEALEYVHRLGVLHTTITPDSIVFDERDEPLLADLEVGRLLTSTAWLVGTDTPTLYPYLAPEIFQGAAPSVQSDLYMLGAVLYEVIAGHEPRPPVNSTAPANPQPVMPLAANRPDCPTQLAELVMELIQPAPADRPNSAGEVAARLAALQPGGAAFEETEPPDPFGYPWSSPAPGRPSGRPDIDRGGQGATFVTWVRHGIALTGLALLALVAMALLAWKIVGYLDSLSAVPNRASQVMIFAGGLIVVGIPIVTVVLPRIVREVSASNRHRARGGQPRAGAIAWRTSLSLLVSLLFSFLRSDDDGFDDGWLDRAVDILEDTSFQLLGEFHSGGSLPDDDSYHRRR